MPKEDALTAMGKAYVELLDDTHPAVPDAGYAACSDPVIQARVRECYGALVKRGHAALRRRAEQVWQFFSHGMLLNVIASLDLAAIADARVGDGLVRADGR